MGGGDSKGWGKSKGKDSWGGGGGKGKGKTGLRSFPNDKKVWIGGLTGAECSKELNKELCEHMKQAGQCLFAEVGKSGMGGAAYKTEDEVQNAIAILNGSDFNGTTIEVDVWTKKES